MHLIKFKAKCPYQIGDKVQFDDTGKTMEVTDIITKISAKTGKVTFILQLDNRYMLDTATHDIKIP